MAAITYAPWVNRMYFHHEGTSQFGGGYETLGYLTSTFNSPVIGFESPRAEIVVTINTAPTVTAPANIVITSEAGRNGASVPFAATAIGTPNPTIAYTINGSAVTSPYFFPIGVTTVKATASNSCSTDSKTFTVTVTDTQKPTITASNVTVNTDATSCNAQPTIPTLTLNDNSGIVGYIETFEKFTVGNVSGQNGVWAAWPGGASSSQVSSSQASSGQKSLKIEGGRNEDQLFFMGDQTSGTWTLKFKMYVPVGKRGYYNIQHTEEPGVEWAHEAYFYEDGTGEFYAGAPHAFSYPQGQWFEVSQTMNLDTDQATLLINGVEVATWQFSNQQSGDPGIKKLGSIDFYPADETYLFYVDDLALYGTPTAMGQYVARTLTKAYATGKTTPTFTISDLSGNTETASFDVTVEDKTNPVAIAKNITVQLDATGAVSITANQVNNGSTDNCGIASLALSKTTFDCSNVGPNPVTLTVTDNSGNTHTANATVTVEDKVKPVALAKNITVQLNATGSATITIDQVNNGSTDNCGIASVTLSKTAFTCENVGANQITLTVTDVHGNVSTATATVTVEDKINPTAIAKNITVQLNAQGTVTIAPTDVNNGSSDNCGIASVTLDKTSFNCANVGENTVTLTVTDVNGNSATATAVVTVEDKVKPVALAKNITVQLDATGNAAITAAEVNNNSTDNCGIASVTLDKTSFTCANVGANTVTITVTDVNGNVSTATATVTVEDKVKPVALAKNITVQLNASGTATLTAADVDNGSSDNCGIQSITLSRTAFDCANVGTNNVTLTVTDVHGNVSTAPAVVTVEDKINPTITAPAAVTVNVDPGKTTASNVNLGTPATADNCSVATVTNDAPAEYPTGTTTITWTVTDASGNTSTATQIVTVRPNAVSVVRPATLEVPIRTTFAQVTKPATVGVTFTDGNTVQVPVTWQQGTYNGLENGDYEITGILSVPSDKSNVNNVEAKWTVRVMPNKAPTNITLSKSTFQPSIGPDQAIGSFTTTDEDDPIDNQPENQHLYELVTGAGSTDNALFEIDGNQLYLKSNKGLSGKTSFSIRVRTVDPYNNTFEKTFTLTKEGYNVATVDLKIVNAFSPNGDGVNDNWTVPELRFYNNVEVQVFDRAGVRLFHTTNPEQGWDGRNQRGEVLAGPYLYIIHVKDINYVKRGTVTILKK
ncbi:gliding motility-associated C-terminal domain-containing protein [Sabulibacter ruber]|uniref:T9SS type B sorting domain-containing protein n=1 Tax=Sabulibacter ruber TaxID=2811901 RepID=UPI001A97BA9D|nr:gliding motility-associated C-terminal domain-containing protein [Sabulibacter ruber]